MARKRGRPRNDRPRFDLGTPELMLKRMMISPNDPTRATTPLDACLARGVISDEAYSAACFFAAIRKNIFGKAIPPAIDLTAVSRASRPDEQEDGNDLDNYGQACATMKAINRRSFDAVENLVVHERWPDWMFKGSVGKRADERKIFCLGIAALLGWYKGSRRKAA